MDDYCFTKYKCNVDTFIGNVIFYNVGSCYSSVNGRFTADRDGLYYF